MGRPVVLSNGQLFVGLDEQGLVHDFYYPYVGLENLTNARSSQHKIGVWVDKTFSWIDDGTWDIQVDLESDALIGKATIVSLSMEIKIETADYVDIQDNILIRHLEVTNLSSKKREVRLFMHQVFQISRMGRGDTAMYVPDGGYILDYKGRYCLAIGGKTREGMSFDQYAVGNYAIEGKDGTYLDALDGELSGNPVEHGGVDSVLRFSRELEAKASMPVDYWVIAETSQTDAQKVHDLLLKTDMSQRLNDTRMYWRNWLEGVDEGIPEKYQQSLKRSLLIIKAHCDVRGSVLASGDSSIFNYGRDYYCYCWPRDASLAVWPLIRVGKYKEAKAYFEFARDTLHPDGYLMHKYQPDRAVGSTWHPLVHGKNKELAIQEDETATTLFILGQYYKASNDKLFIENIYNTLVRPAADFMCGYVDKETGLPHASYDLWEEKFLTSTYTVSTVIAGLDAAAELSLVVEQPADNVRWKQAADDFRDNLAKLVKDQGCFSKGFFLNDQGELEYDTTIDISNLYGPYMFGGLPLTDSRLRKTAEIIQERLLDSSPSGGVIRYENDGYFLEKKIYKGNPWAVCGLWLAQYFHSMGEEAQADSLLDWAMTRQLASGAISEQFDPEDASPLGVTPLVWSHAEMVNTILDLKRREN
ncbi:MAG TPA: glycoside hydrolase family 15 protein [Candidatus Saccharimonadales bacterium]|nr:glycoside hydrolase family 15 protein [Candidatus Saccharimonadales bacterium]